MAADYASLEDFKKHWSALPPEDEADAAQKLHEASIEVRGLYPDIDGRIASGAIDAEVPRLVVNRMVKRAMEPKDDNAPPAGMESFQFGAGPFSMGGKMANPDNSIYLSAADKRLLTKSKHKSAFTIIPGA